MDNQNKQAVLTSGRITSTQNLILNALPEDEYQRLQPFLALVYFNRGRLIYRQGDSIDYVYFPTEGIISVTSNTEDGKIIESGTIGKEGMTGIDVILGVETTHYESIVRIPGSSYRVQTEIIKNEFKQGGMLQRLLLRYTHTFLAQISQTILCNSLHSVESRMAAKLLNCRNHLGSDYLELTHEVIAAMICATRPGVTVAAAKLQDAGLITYTRGKIEIIDLKGLEETACECYHKPIPEFGAFPGQ